MSMDTTENEKLPICSGIVPVKWLSDKSKYPKDIAVIDLRWDASIERVVGQVEQQELRPVCK